MLATLPHLRERFQHPKEAKAAKDCATCKHEGAPSVKEPCKSCIAIPEGFTLWEEGEPEKESAPVDVLALNPGERIEDLNPKTPGEVIEEEMTRLEDAFKAALQDFTKRTGLVAPAVKYEHRADRDAAGRLMECEYYCFEADVKLSVRA